MRGAVAAGASRVNSNDSGNESDVDRANILASESDMEDVSENESDN